MVCSGPLAVLFFIGIPGACPYALCGARCRAGVTDICTVSVRFSDPSKLCSV